MAVMKSNLTLRLDLDVNAKIKIIAKQEQRSVCNFINFILRREIQRYESENGQILLNDGDLFTE